MKIPKIDNFPPTFQFDQIGVIHSCFKEKFGIPRQPGLATKARATLELTAPYDQSEAISGLEGFSHIWIIFVFHEANRENWRPTVRPPRLGGNQRMGVFASRSPYRPNPVGISVVKIEKIDRGDGCCLLHLSGADLLDGTPVLDIKPYLPYVDAIPEADGGYANNPPQQNCSVSFSDKAAIQCEQYEKKGNPELKQLIEQLLSLDPRPAYLADKSDSSDSSKKQKFGMRLYDFDLRWIVEEDRVIVLELASVLKT